MMDAIEEDKPLDKGRKDGSYECPNLLPNINTLNLVCL